MHLNINICTLAVKFWNNEDWKQLCCFTFCGNNETQSFKSFGGKIIKKEDYKLRKERKKEILLFSKENIKLVKSDSKEIYNVTKKKSITSNVDILNFVLINNP